MSKVIHTASCTNTSQKEAQETIEVENLELCIRNDKAEVEILESEDIAKDERAEAAQDDERIAKIKFNCFYCGMEEMVHYFGTEPSFVFGIKFNEPTYVMRDPFQPPPPKWMSKPECFLALGAHCKLCDHVVCKDTECSFFYINSYCLSCVKKVANSFPVDIQQKLRKQLALI